MRVTYHSISHSSCVRCEDVGIDYVVLWPLHDAGEIQLLIAWSKLPWVQKKAGGRKSTS